MSFTFSTSKSACISASDLARPSTVREDPVTFPDVAAIERIFKRALRSERAATHGAPLFQLHFDGATPAPQRIREIRITESNDAASQLPHACVVHATVVVSGLECDRSVDQHHRKQILKRYVRHLAPVHDPKLPFGNPDRELVHVGCLEAVLGMSRSEPAAALARVRRPASA